MGRLFTSFDEAWASFLRRTQPLESFYDEFPDDPDFVLERWLIVPPAEIKREALRVQGELEELEGLKIVPHHFLHVTLDAAAGGADFDELLELGPFELGFPRVNCFPTAVVAEAESDELARLDTPATFLPHLSLGYLELPLDPAPVREVVVPLRDRSLGSFLVDEVVHVRIPAGRTTVLDPWTVVERLALRR